MTAQMVGGMIAGTFLVYYMTERMLITTLVMSSLMLAARFVDLLIGLLAGVVIQRFRPKLGQYRTWLLLGPIIVGTGTTLCFINPAIPVAAKAVIVFVGYILYGGGMSFIQTSQNGMLAKIAGPDIQTRLRISAKIIQGQNAGTIIASATMVPFIMFLEARGTDGYSAVQVIYAAVGILGQLCLFLGTRQFDGGAEAAPAGTANPAEKGPGIGAMLLDTMKNGQLVILFLADSLRWAATMTIMTLGAYYYNLVAKDPNMMTLGLTVQSVLGLVLAFMIAPLSRKLGKKNSALTTGILTAISYAGLAFFAGRGAVFYIVFSCAAYASQLVVNSCGVNLYLDCGEYQLYRQGKDNRTFVMSVYGLGIKIGFMLSSVVVGLILSGGGYNGAEIADPGRMVMLIGLVPAGLNLVYILLMGVYGITEEKSREYAEHNHARTAEAAAG
jgi:Na+/melibiose symporter-like transporter